MPPGYPCQAEARCAIRVVERARKALATPRHFQTGLLVSRSPFGQVPPHLLLHRRPQDGITRKGMMSCVILQNGRGINCAVPCLAITSFWIAGIGQLAILSSMIRQTS